MGKESKNFRTLDMYVRLCEGKNVNKAEEARRFNVDERSIQRDIDDIRAFLDERSMSGDGRTIEYDRIKKGFVMVGDEPSMMTNSEILAVSKILLESRAFTKRELKTILDKMVEGCVPLKIRYLTEKRGIEKNLVEEWIGRGDIYEEKKHHNVVFVGRDADGIPRYAHCRGTGEIKYRGDVAGSDKSYGFSHRGTDNQLFVFEAAIDLLSFIQLFPKDWKKRSYLSLGGISSVALMAFLSERPQITSVFLCLDNDQAGNEACEKLAGEIRTDTV